MASKDILIIENLADFEKKINRDQRAYDVNMMVMPGALEDKHKDVDPEKGIQALRGSLTLFTCLWMAFMMYISALITGGSSPMTLSSFLKTWYMLPRTSAIAVVIACISKLNLFSLF
jgi:hypothetical protein